MLSDGKKGNGFFEGESATEPAALKSVDQATEAIGKKVAEIMEWVLRCKSIHFLEFESQLIGRVYEFGRLFVALFLCMRERQWQLSHPEIEAGCKRQGLNDRVIGVVFGKVRNVRGKE